MRLLRDRIASLGATVLDRITSEISRLRAISSLKLVLAQEKRIKEEYRLGSHKLLLVALSICSSKAELAEDDHQPIMISGCSCGLIKTWGKSEGQVGDRSKSTRQKSSR